jgi:hypothetical protein
MPTGVTNIINTQMLRWQVHALERVVESDYYLYHACKIDGLLEAKKLLFRGLAVDDKDVMSHQFALLSESATLLLVTVNPRTKTPPVFSQLSSPRTAWWWVSSH